VAEQNFDAWGRKRNVNNWQYDGVQPVLEWMYRGYTGHEHLPQFGLINMNGRMYDPVQGRMLSPDNYVATPFGTQGYNRYSYANNNPLAYVDPDGNFIVPIIIGAAVGAFFGGVQADMQGKSFFDGAWKGAIVGGVGGAFSLIGGGSFLANVAWGAGEAVVTNGLSNLLNNNPFFQGAGVAAAIGGGFAALTSWIEANRNFEDGYGFGTNKGIENSMIKEYRAAVGTTNEAAKANTLISFVKKRYGMLNANFMYDQSSSFTSGAFGVTPPVLTNDIYVDPSAFGSTSLLKATMVHEYGRLILDKIIANGVVNWAYPAGSYTNSLGNAILTADGPLGYAQEIYNAGRLHINPSILKPQQLNPLYSIWNGNRYGWKLFHLLPRRFNTGTILKFY
jgi:RHS repeat-associated protein